nr:putative reverse transcriptase domain-containing protein [Tanacetum cinerariifolium]
MMTQSVGRSNDAPRGGRTGGRTGKGGGRTGEPTAELVVELVIKMVKEVTERTPGQEFHSTKFIAMRSTGIVHQKKSKTYNGGKEQERVFQTLKDKLCNALILSLPDGPEDFVVYCDASCQGLGIELFNNYDIKIRYHLGKANIVANALTRKNEASEVVNAPAEILRGLEEQMERKSDGALYYLDQIWVPLTGDSMQEALGTQLDMKTVYHPQTDGQSERTIQALKDMLKACVVNFRRSLNVHLPLVEFSYSNSYLSRQLIGPAIVQKNTEKISQIKDRLKAARDCQKSYADKRRKPLEFSVGNRVLLKVSPWKGVVRFGKKIKLAPSVHDTFHVLNLKKCLDDLTLQIPLKEIQVDAKLNFVEEPVEILEREIKTLKQSRIPIIKDQ